MENQNFKKLILLLESKGNFESLLKDINQSYLVKVYNISNLKSETVISMYSALEKKFYNGRIFSNEEFWSENQLRIFIWLLFAYTYVFQKNISSFAEQDWIYFSSIFNGKRTKYFEFQAKLLSKSRGKSTPWSEEEIIILTSIINDSQYKNRWNTIARQFFFKSNRRYFRSPKQCREQWRNHIDPSKVHSKWTQPEDLALLNCIKKNGKKWSIAANELNQTRTEHMVKNRYYSLLKKQNKRHKGNKTPDQLQCFLIKKLTKSVMKRQKSLFQLKQEDEHINYLQKAPNQFEGTTEYKDGFDHQFFKENKEAKKDYSTFDINLNEQIKYLRSPSNTLLMPQKVEQLYNQKFDFMDDGKHFLSLNMCYHDESNQQRNILEI